MLNIVKNIQEKSNNIYLIYFFITLSIILVFYPISSGSAIMGYFGLFYVLINYKKLLINKMLLSISTFSIWVVISCLATYNNYNNDSSGFLIKELRFFFMFLMLTIMIQKIPFKNILKIYLSIGAIFIFLGYLEVLTVNSFDCFFKVFRSHAQNLHLYFDDNVPRLLSISRNTDPNFVAFVIAVLFITIMVCIFYERITTHELNIKYCLYGLLTAIALLLTGSRGGVLVALFSLFILTLIIARIFRQKVIYKALLLIVILGIFLLGVLTYFLPDNIFIAKISALFSKSTWQRGTSEGMRFEMISLSFQLLKENILFGVGPTGFQASSHLPEFYIKSLAAHNFRDPHNFLLSIGMISGLPGMCLIIYIIFNSIINCVKYLKTRITLGDFVVLAWALCFLGTIPFEYPLQDECRLVFLNLFFAIVCVYYNKKVYNEK